MRKSSSLLRIAPNGGELVGVSPQPHGGHCEPGLSDERWPVYMFRAGTSAVVFFQIAYLWHELGAPAGEKPLALGLYLFNVGLPCLTFGLSWSACFQRYWRHITMAMCVAVIGGMAALNVLHDENVPMFIAVVLFLAGTGSLIPWNEHWQAALSSYGLAAFGIVEVLVPSTDPYEFLRWLGLLTAVGIAQLAMHLSGRYRHSLAARFTALAQSEQRLRESEATIRRIFDAIPDLVIVSRLRDGKILQVNEEFLKRTGLPRERVLSSSSIEIGLWARPDDRNEFAQKMSSNGRVCNMEMNFRLQGQVAPYQGSGVVVDWDGEACIVGVARDMTQMKDSERALRETQQRLSMQVQELTASEARVRQREATIRQLFDAVPDIVTLTRFSDGKLLEVNREFLQRSGLSREQALQTTVVQADAWVRPQERDSYVQQMKTEGRVRNLEVEFRLNGVVAPYFMSSIVVEVDGEKVALNVARDATQIKENERALREARERLNTQVEELTSTQMRLRNEIAEREAAERFATDREATLRKIFEASPDCIMIRRLNDGRFVEINKKCSLTGYSREEVLGKTPEELGIWVDATQAAEYREKLEAEGQMCDMELKLRHRDGRVIEVFMSAAVVVLGGESCVISIARDITQIKENERKLRDAQRQLSIQVEELTIAQRLLRAEVAERKAAEHVIHERETTLRKIFEATTDGIAIFSLVDGRIIDVNSEFSRVTGYTRQEALAAPRGTLQIWVHDEQREWFVRELRATGAVRNMEAEFVNRGAAISTFLISGSTVELGDELWAVCVMRDITAIKRAQDELMAAREQALAASRAKSEFLSSMSHEIRTPMNAILGMAEVLCETPLDTDQHRYLGTMRSNGSALLSLLDDILDLAKVESGRMQLEAVDFDLDELVERAVETLAVRAHGKGLELVVRVVPGVPRRLVGDPFRLRQILINLLSNAVKFTELGEVALMVEPAAASEDSCFHFSVADTGIGIAPDNLAAIFSNFTQADSSTTRKYGGSGLGLAIASRLVELMGGRIWVESKPGGGSTFHFTARLKLSGSGSVVQTSAQHSLKGLRALVADRNAINRLIITETLGERGTEVVEAVSVEEIVRELRHANHARRPFDVALCDWQMPGIEKIERLARSKGWCGARLIIPMLTTDDLNSKLASLHCFGLQTHLLKPVRRFELVDVIGRTVAARLNGSAAAATEEICAAKSPEQPDSLLATVAPAQPLRLLLADDSFDNRLLISAYVKNLPIEIDMAENGQVAVEKCLSGHYDLVLMDIQMPVMDGYSAVRVIRAFEAEHRLQPMPILALTASTLDDDIRRALEAGCNAHVAKPVRKTALLEAVGAVLAHAAPVPAQAQEAAVDSHY